MTDHGGDLRSLRTSAKPVQTEALTHFAFLLLPDFSHLAFSCAVEPLRLANLVAGQTLYRWTLVGEGGAVAASNGCETVVKAGLEAPLRADRLFVVAGRNARANTSAQLQTYLRRERALGTPLAGICTGALVLARCGFLDGSAAAVHWACQDAFAEEFPNVRLMPGVFVADGAILTASGGTAAADLMLCLIRRAHGAALATQVADQMIYNTVREDTAPQRVSFQSRHGMRNAHLSRAVALMEQHIEDPISPGDIADEIGLSTRQLERLFNRYLNTTPKAHFMDLRLTRARNLLIQSELSVTEVAIAAGFVSHSHFSKVFRLRFGLSPHRQRATLS